MYGTYLTLAALLLLAYELWRASSTPGLQKISRRAFLAGGIVLALLLVVGRRLGHDASGSWAASLEFISMGLIGSSFLIFVCLFPVDLILGFGLFFCPDGGRIRGPRRGRLAAVGAYPRRADMALEHRHAHGEPPAGRALRCRGHDGSGQPRCRHLGAQDALVAARGNHAGHPEDAA